MPRKKKEEKDIAVVPYEKGVNEAGVPYVRAMLVADPDSKLGKEAPFAKAQAQAQVLKGPQKSRIPRDAPKSFYKMGAVVEPYLKPQMLQSFMLSNPIHAICVKKKARLVAGLGIKLITKFDEREARTIVRKYEKDQEEKAEKKKAEAAQKKALANTDPNAIPAPEPTLPELVKMYKAENIDRKAYLEAKKKIATSKLELERLQNFIDDASDKSTFRELLERGWADFESIGNMNWEVLRDEHGEPARMVHISALQMRVTKDGERAALVTPPYTNPIFFKLYGDERHLNFKTGEFRPWKGEQGQDNFDPGKDWGPEEATEVLRYVSYNPQDTNYGIPEWYAALADMIGGAESRDFMLRFFTDKAVPLYAVLLEGGAWTEDTIMLIEKFFRRDLVGNYHATLALEVPTGGKITFEQVSPEPRWWPFVLKYQDAVRDVVVSVHGLSPSIVGVIETAHLGGGTGGDQMETVKTTEIRPRQEMLEWLLNQQIARNGLGLNLVMMKLDEIDTTDETQVASEIASLFSNPTRPSMTLNEARKKLRLSPIDSDWADKILISDPQFGLMPLEDMEAAVRMKQKAMQVAGAEGGQEVQPGNQGPATPGAPGTPLGQATGAGMDFESLMAQIAKTPAQKSVEAEQFVESLREQVRRALNDATRVH